MARRRLQILATALALAAGVLSPAAAEPNFPAFTAPVVDAAHVLSATDVEALKRRLVDLQAKTGTQFAVATVPSLDGEEIEPYANALFRRWKLGRKDVNDGLLLLVAPKEHRLRFEVGYGLEGTMTDIQSNLIINNTMVPKLKAGDPAGAIRAGVDDAIKVLGGEPMIAPRKPAAAAGQQLDPITLLLILAFVIFILILIWRSTRRGGSAWPWIAGGAGGFSTSGDNSSSSGGDDFSGGGGGDSGGGGSSGSW